MVKNICKNLIVVCSIITLLLVIMLSKEYIIKKANHTCSDNSCPICMLLSECHENLNHIGKIESIVFIAISFISFCLNVSRNQNKIINKKSLITLKTRIND